MELIPTRRTEQSLFPLQRQMNRLFEDFFGGSSPLTSWEAEDWVPTLDIAENDEELVVTAELPGVDPDKLSITVTGDLLTLKGEKASQSEESTGTVHRRERAYGSFVRTVSLPSSIDPERVTASGKDGIVTIHLAKREEAKPRSISVKVD